MTRQQLEQKISIAKEKTHRTENLRYALNVFEGKIGYDPDDYWDEIDVGLSFLSSEKEAKARKQIHEILYAQLMIEWNDSKAELEQISHELDALS